MPAKALADVIYEAGRTAYQFDIEQCPRYPDGVQRKRWDELDFDQKESWRRNPTPRDPATALNIPPDQRNDLDCAPPPGAATSR